MIVMGVRYEESVRLISRPSRREVLYLCVGCPTWPCIYRRWDHVAKTVIVALVLYIPVHTDS